MNTRKKLNQQSKLTFSGSHKSCENCNSYSFEQNEVNLYKPIYSGFAIIELSKLHMYETYYDKLQPSLGEKKFARSLYG